MTQDPSTGQGYDAVQVGEESYFDPNAQDPAFPGDTGLQIRKKTFWQGDVQFDTFETVGPVYGPIWPQGTLRAGGLGVSSNVFGLSNKQPPTTDPHDFGIPGNSGISGMNLAPGMPGGLAPSSDGGPVVPVIDCDPDGIFGPMYGEDANDIQIILQGVYQDDGTLGDLYIPVPPEDITADFPQDNDGDTDTLGGEITIPGTERLESIGWTSFFPRDYNPSFVVVNPDVMPDPTAAIISLIWSKRFRLPLTLNISGTPWNDLVIIKTLKWTFKHGEPGDVYYDIQFKRYRSTSISTVVLPNAPTEPKDYPTYQGPPPLATPISEQARDKWGSDGSISTEVQVDPPAGDPGSTTPADTSAIIGPQPDTTGAQPGVYLTSPALAAQAPPPTETTTVTYNVAAKFNWSNSSLITGQSLSDVYEAVKSWSPQNTLGTLLDMNKDQPANDHKGRLVVGDYKPYDNLPWNTPLIVYKTQPKRGTSTLTPQNVAAGN